jgi:putative ATP-dependent endonuclease of OLD family
VLARAPKKGEQRQYKPLVGIPAELREQIPLIHIGVNRSLAEQLPSARQSMLRRLFDDVNAVSWMPATELMSRCATAA